MPCDTCMFTMIHYFGGKEDLVLAVLLRTFDVISLHLNGVVLVLDG